MASEQEQRVLVAQLQQLEAEARAYEQQMDVINFTMQEIQRAIEATEALSKTDIGKDSLIPIGANSYVYGSIPQATRIIIGLGSSVSAEVEVADAVKHLQERRTKLTEVQGQFAARLNEISAQMYALQTQLQAAG
ncbi:MAG: prefoldin subunit alpha [Halobacteriota archaeon]